MKKVFIYFIFTLIIFFFSCNLVKAKEVNVYMFYGKGCPHCEEALEYLNDIKDEYELNIIKYEVWYNQENQKIMNEVSDYLDINPTGVPFVIIDNSYIFGYSKGITDDTYRYHIKLASKENFIDKVGIKLGVVKQLTNENKISKVDDSTLYSLQVPLFKDINLKNVSLYFSTIILGLLDGFSMCILWILLFLICLLINTNDKKKILLSLLFIFSSIITYLFILISSYSFENIINYFSFIRVIISLVALVFGSIRLNYFAEQLDEKRCEKKPEFGLRKVFNKKILSIFVILGLILLGISSVLINIYHDSNMMILFNNLLSLNTISGIRRIMFIIVYVLFYILSNVLILLILLFIFRKAKNKFKKYTNLISGVLLLIIGILLLLKPEWLMF